MYSTILSAKHYPNYWTTSSVLLNAGEALWGCTMERHYFLIQAFSYKGMKWMNKYGKLQNRPVNACVLLMQQQKNQFHALNFPYTWICGAPIQGHGPGYARTLPRSQIRWLCRIIFSGAVRPFLQSLSYRVSRYLAQHPVCNSHSINIYWIDK